MAIPSLALRFPIDRFTLEPSTSNPDMLPPLYGLLLAHCLVGLVAAMVAHRKGYDLGRWLIGGVVGGTPALLLALSRPDLRQGQ